MKKSILAIFIAVAFVGCKSMVNPNEWVVSTSTCWNTMTVSKAGDYVPRVYTTCDRIVILPATYMAADLQVESKFAARVAGQINLTYQWQIVDPIKFIYNAKSITSAPTSDDKKIDPNALEALENSTVDKMLIDLIREYTPQREAGIDELKIEQDLYDLCKNKFKDRGVEFASLSINVNYSPQTEEALDVISALKFYELNGEKELGRAIIVAKAGANNISLNTNNNK